MVAALRTQQTVQGSLGAHGLYALHTRRGFDPLLQIRKTCGALSFVCRVFVQPHKQDPLRAPYQVYY